LLKIALGWLFIGSPPQDGSAVSEPTARKMIVGDFDYVFRPHWVPLRRPFGRPSARTTWSISRKASILLYCLKLVGESRLVLAFDTRRKVKSRKQAIAIGLSKARKKGKKVPKKKSRS
jgi:hypothetical protein